MMTKKEKALVNRIHRAYPPVDPKHPATDAAILKTARHWIENGQKKNLAPRVKGRRRRER